MKKKTKLTAILLVLCMVIELLPSNIALVSTMVTAFAADGHKHCICGADHHSIGDHTNKNEISFSAWSSTNSLPDKKGNYYLMDDVTIAGAWYPVDGTVLCLNGHTITAYNASVIIVSDYTNKDVKFTLTDCKENNIGKITHSEGGIGSGVYVYGKGNFIMYGGIITGNFTSNDGGGVFNQGTFTMNGGSITKNKAGVLGGGVANSATFTMNGGIITGNNADYGGGVYNFSNFIMNGGSITSNTANESGGGVRNQATFTMKGGNITENNAEYGGGVDISTTGNFTMDGGSINGNTANEKGGGVSNSGNFTMNVDAYIHDNTASTGGGVSNEGSFTMNSSYIGENKATKDGGGVFNSGTLIMNSGKIGYNEAKGDSGGGVSNKGTFKVNGYVIIAENYGKIPAMCIY